MKTKLRTNHILVICILLLALSWIGLLFNIGETELWFYYYYAVVGILIFWFLEYNINFVGLKMHPTIGESKK
jgi:hypothetical protein